MATMKLVGGRYGSHGDVVLRGISVSLVLLASLMLLAGCSGLARHEASGRAPKNPATPWNPPAKLMKHAEGKADTLALPKELAALQGNWTLADVVSLALRNNPATKATWASALAASAKVGSKRGGFLPQVNGSVNYVKSKNYYGQDLPVSQKIYQPSLELQWILFDFGKTKADYDEAKQQLYAANWSHNAMIQSVILEVETAFYQYQYAKAVRVADSVAVQEASANLDAAEERHKAGLATVGDVLQAKSNLAQRKLALQGIEGQIQTIRGSLATAMGISPAIKFDVGMLPSDLPLSEATETVDTLLQQAVMLRPDLGAARASAQAAKAHARSLKRERLPALSLQGSMNRRFYDNPDNFSDNYTQGLYLTMPLFTGFSHSYDIVEAQAKAESARQQYEVLKGKIELDVWSSYYDLKTANEQVTTAGEFLASASESHDVALGRYKSGVGTILELLGAQASLEEARAEDLLARTNWFLALAGLAHATGQLGPPQPGQVHTSPQDQSGDRQ
jgi:outer membrane protein